MPYELFLALRYLRSRQRRRMARVTALLAVIGIAFGVGSLVVALALANGFRDEMRDKILRGTAHLTVTRNDGQPLADYRDVIRRIRAIPEVTAASPTTYDGAVVSGPNASAYAVLRGVDTGSTTTRFELQSKLTAGSLDSLFEPPVNENNEPRLPNVILGSELAKRTGLQVNDVAEIIPAGASVARRAPIYRNVRVAGIFHSGLFEYDSTWIYLSFERAAVFAGPDRPASLVSVEVQNVDDIKQVGAKVRVALGNDYTTVDWQEANQQLFNALALERRVGMIVIALIILIAALNITTSLVMVVVERRSDIAILRTMGAAAKSIMAVFMIEGAVIGGIGAMIGAVLGQAACLAGNRYRLVRLPADVYSITSVPFNSQLRDVLLAAAVAFSLSLLATIYPAQAAARVRPAQALRERN
ncbi:MAG: ABC transporter permease [Acidobacteriota bacterium]|nr:ABC transporter permease [Acidobacteriota bacterium]